MSAALPELEAVAWRRRTDTRSLRLREQISAGYTALYVTPLLVVAVGLLWLEPFLFPVSALALVHAWVIPELFANRGAGVVRLKRQSADGSEQVAQGLLGDLLGHDERDLQRRTGLALERGRLGVWLVGDAGALLVRPGGRRVHTIACAWPTASCLRRTAWRTCCSPCDRTSRASQRSRITRSPAPPGASGAGWRRCGAPRSMPPSPRRVSAQARREVSPAPHGTTRPRAARSTPRSRSRSGRRPWRERPAALPRRAPGRRPP